MAKRVTKDHASKRATSADDQAAEDLNVLCPDVELTIRGRKLVVREYGFNSGWRVRAKAKPIADEIQRVLQDGSAAEMVPEDYMDILARHWSLTFDLIMDSVEGVDADWLESLTQSEGRALVYAWWGVCSRFFFREETDRLLQRVVREAKAATDRAGQTSSGQPPATSTSTSGPSESGAPSAS